LRSNLKRTHQGEGIAVLFHFRLANRRFFALQPFIAKLLNGEVNFPHYPLLPLRGYTDDRSGFLDLKRVVLDHLRE